MATLDFQNALALQINSMRYTHHKSEEEIRTMINTLVDAIFSNINKTSAEKQGSMNEDPSTSVGGRRRRKSKKSQKKSKKSKKSQRKSKKSQKKNQ
jgi:hypothetical protein